MTDTVSVCIRDGMDAMNFSKVTAMLTETYWSKGIGEAEVIRSARHSALVIGAFLGDGEQIAYARVVSDTTRFAYIMDVCVDERYRSAGIGQTLMKAILNHKALSLVYQWMLTTSTAHAFYARLGFASTERAADLMEIRHARPER